ncbi:MAG TPA: DinB family protein [Actinomycetota bacterium]|nr:DinB family protein [Actinomycetota bacterium]
MSPPDPDDELPVDAPRIDAGSTTRALLDAEAAAAGEIEALISDRSVDEVSACDLNDDGWSVRYLIAHIAHWQDACAHAIEHDLGEYDGDDDEIDRVNAALIDGIDGVPWEQTLEDWARARSRSRSALESIDVVTPSAETWFREEGIDHMAEHTVELRRWAERRRDMR